MQQLTQNIGVVYSGMGPDSRVLVRKARKAAQRYYRTYLENIPVSQLVREIASIMQEFTQSGYGHDVCVHCLMMVALKWCEAVWCVSAGGWLR